VSDAGAPLRPTPSPASAWHAQALRAMDIAVEQDRALRKLRLIADFESGARGGAYWGITTKIADYCLPDTLNVAEAATRYLSSIRTRLDPFSEDEQERLINGGYAFAMRRFDVPAWRPLLRRPSGRTRHPRWIGTSRLRAED